jgi:hypothetical protein
MLSTSGVRDVPSSQPKVYVIIKTWDLGGEVHEACQIIQDSTGCVVFSLKELG